MAPARIVADVEAIRLEGLRVDIIEGNGGLVGVLLPGYPLPAGIWNREATDLLILVPLAYPNAKLDMFWVTLGLRLAEGPGPKSADAEQEWFGRRWQRFSWHIAHWNPARDTILTFLREVIDHRLSLAE